MKVQQLRIITEPPVKIKRDVMAEICSVVISSRIPSISVQCVITPLIARHGARKPAQTLFSSSVRHQQQLEMLWKATPRKQRPELWSHFELCLFICSSDMNDSSVIWLVLLLYKSSYKRLRVLFIFSYCFSLMCSTTWWTWEGRSDGVTYTQMRPFICI